MPWKQHTANRVNIQNSQLQLHFNFNDTDKDLQTSTASEVQNFALKRITLIYV